MNRTGVVVVGGGQAGLAAGFYLRRAGLDFVILDAQSQPGGAWTYAWPSLRLFSPAQYSSLPGRPMPHQAGQEYPDATHTVDYLAAYEKHYSLPVHRPVHVEAVERAQDGLLVRTDQGMWHAQHVISATGTWWRPFIPSLPGIDSFRGLQLHTRSYRGPADLAGQRVAVVGAGNSGAQIAADLAEHTTVRWSTLRPPHYLPDEVDGRALFDLATRRHQALQQGQGDTGGIGALGDIVAVPPVRRARDRGLLNAQPMFDRLDAQGLVWDRGQTWPCDVVVWCTGFRPELGHLAPLGLRERDGTIAVNGTRAVREPRLDLLGYGDWTGPASATLIGVGRTARDLVRDLT